jgi:hypothetical protein
MDINKSYTIYGLYNNDNKDNLLYIGSSADFKARIRTHISNIRHNNTNSKIKLYRYIKDNKINIFPCVLYSDISTKDIIANKEQEFINLLKPLLNVRHSYKNNRSLGKFYRKKYYMYLKESNRLRNIIY